MSKFSGSQTHYKEKIAYIKKIFLEVCLSNSLVVKGPIAHEKYIYHPKAKMRQWLLTLYMKIDGT